MPPGRQPAAGRSGHLVFSPLHTIDASKTVDRIVATFETGDQQTIRRRLAASLRLIPARSGGRMAVFEILTSTMRTREYIERGEAEGRSLLDAMRDGEMEGMRFAFCSPRELLSLLLWRSAHAPSPSGTCAASVTA